MKILFLNEYVSDRPVSGAEYSLMALAEGLRSVKQKVIIYSPPWKKNQSGKGLSPLWFNQPIYYLYSAWQIARIIRQGKIDLIHVHGKYILPGAVIAGWLTGKPVVVTVRDFKFLCPLALCFTNEQTKCSLSYFIKQEIAEYCRRYGGGSVFSLILAKLWQYQLKWWLNQCQKVIAVSPQLAQIYRENGVRRVESIYNLPPTSRRGRRIVNKNIVLSVGKLSFGKGTDAIIEAAKLLPQFKFIFAGELNPSFKTAFPKNCRYLGKINHEAVLKLYPQAAVFVINSRWPEPLSRAGLEALAFGLPIVASDRGGNRELINHNGFLVNPDKSREIAAAITQALLQKKQLGLNSANLLKSRFKRRQILTRHLNLYRTYAANNKA